VQRTIFHRRKWSAVRLGRNLPVDAQYATRTWRCPLIRSALLGTRVQTAAGRLLRGGRTAAVRDGAQDVLSRWASQRVRLGPPARLPSSARTLVYRFPVADGPSNLPATVVVKQATRHYGARFREAVDGNVWNDWAGLRFLEEAMGSSELVPRLYGGDGTRGLLVLEDVGSSATLADALIGSSAAASEAALLQFFAGLGRIHGSTRQHISRFLAIRYSLGSYHLRQEYVAMQCAGVARKFGEIAQALDIRFHGDVERDLDVIAQTLLDPGPFAVYLHGDPAPGNGLLTEHGMKLIDFEYGIPGHALLDGVCARMLFPSSGHVGLIPASLLERVEAVYRTELTKGCPEAGENTLFAQHRAIACAYWATNFCSWMPFADLMKRDRPYGLATLRQLFLLRARIFHQVAGQAAYLEALSAAFSAIVAKLAPRWPEAVDSLMDYPAFRTAERQARW